MFGFKSTSNHATASFSPSVYDEIIVVPSATNVSYLYAIPLFHGEDKSTPVSNVDCLHNSTSIASEANPAFCTKLSERYFVCNPLFSIKFVGDTNCAERAAIFTMKSLNDGKCSILSIISRDFNINAKSLTCNAGSDSLILSESI